MNTSIVDVLIENIQTDLQLLQEVETKMEALKSEKSIIFERLKSSRKDMGVMLKYADETQQKKIETLGFDISEPQKSVNTIATVAFDIIMKVKDNQITNGDLYDAYVKYCKDKKEEAEKYSAFNIKCRSLFNTQKLLRKKGTDPKSTREDIISLNGRILFKEEAIAKEKTETPEKENTPILTSKKTSEKPKEIPLPLDSKKKTATDKKQNNGKR
ncbi:hypothetical protein [Polaribacter porphyrae]|uniref:Uncharacterized protein n=1 Tax=Polaribacter porphyrae TaxID=1137780 RepID=A0A2S7WST4_9FLAO|nr:hypothetical protein [Polaribacter porphyrae]PQJ80665.1 hypothetical protein BTO18_16450 [Polaribacter porphyrae]